jgi:hypothetical protein
LGHKADEAVKKQSRPFWRPKQTSTVSVCQVRFHTWATAAKATDAAAHLKVVCLMLHRTRQRHWGHFADGIAIPSRRLASVR